jgi:hypothetical protein
VRCAESSNVDILKCICLRNKQSAQIVLASRKKLANRKRQAGNAGGRECGWGVVSVLGVG